MFELELEVDHLANIKVIGVGGGGSNAINRMIGAGPVSYTHLAGVRFCGRCRSRITNFSQLSSARLASCYNGVRLVAARGVEALPDSSNMPDSSILKEEPHAESRRAISFPAVVLLFLVLSTAAFLNSPYFLVRAVKVAGCRYLSDYEALLIAGVPENTNIFLVPTGQMERRLLATPRIRTARVYRILPDTISVAIEERTTALYIPYAGSVSYTHLQATRSPWERRLDL